MLISLGRTVVALALATALAVGTAGIASAQTLSVTDAAGDVESADMNSTQTTGTPEPTITNGDIVTTVFQHSGRRISVRVTFTDLQKTGSMRGDFLRLVTNEGVRREVSLYAGPQHWGGQAEMTRPNGRHVRCRIAHDIDYSANVVTLSFPRACVSKPRWVRLGLGSMWLDNGSKVYADDAQRTGGAIEESNLTLSPRLRRG